MAGTESLLSEGDLGIRQRQFLQTITALERKLANGGYCFGDGHGFQAVAILERPVAQRGDSLVQRNIAQRLAAMEGAIVNGFQRRRENHRSQRIAAGIEKITCHVGNPLFKVHILDRVPAYILQGLSGLVAGVHPVCHNAGLTAGIVDGGHAVGIHPHRGTTEGILGEVIIHRQGHGAQGFTVAEGTLSEGDGGIRNGQLCHGCAAIERKVSDGGQRIRQGHLRQAAAAKKGVAAQTYKPLMQLHIPQQRTGIEGIIADGLHGIGKRYPLQNRSAASEQKIADANNALPKINGADAVPAHILQRSSEIKRTAVVGTVGLNAGLTLGIADGFHTCGALKGLLGKIIIHRQRYGTQAVAAAKGFCPHRKHRIRQRQLHHGIAAVEGKGADALHGFGNGNSGKTVTTKENTVFNHSQTVRQRRHGAQTDAATKGILSQTHKSVVQNNVLQRLTFIKGIVANGLQGGGKEHILQRRTAPAKEVVADVGDSFGKVHAPDAVSADVFQGIFVVQHGIIPCPVDHHAGAAVGVADLGHTSGIRKGITGHPTVHGESNGTQSATLTEGGISQKDRRCVQRQGLQRNAAEEAFVANRQHALVRDEIFHRLVSKPSPVAIVQGVDPCGVGNLGVGVGDLVHHFAVIVQNQVHCRLKTFHHGVNFIGGLLEHDPHGQNACSLDDFHVGCVFQIRNDVGVIVQKDREFLLGHFFGFLISLLRPFDQLRKLIIDAYQT